MMHGQPNIKINCERRRLISVDPQEETCFKSPFWCLEFKVTSPKKLFLYRTTRFVLKYNNNKIIYVHSQTQQCILALWANSFDQYGHHQANITQKNVKRLVMYSAENVETYGIPFTVVKVKVKQSHYRPGQALRVPGC
jgi:hypothetical protein